MDGKSCSGCCYKPRLPKQPLHGLSHSSTQTEGDYQAIMVCSLFSPRTRLRSWPPNVKNSKIKSPSGNAGLPRGKWEWEGRLHEGRYKRNNIKRGTFSVIQVENEKWNLYSIVTLANQSIVSSRVHILMQRMAFSDVT